MNQKNLVQEIADHWLTGYGASRNPDNGQRLLNITDISPDLRIERINIEDGRLVIEYAPDGYRSEFDPDW